MPLLELKVIQFRNIAAAELRPDPSLNFLHGPNGSGKTSILEAISMLAHGRSFRTRKFRRLIQEGTGDLTVFGRVAAADGTSASMGVTRTRGGESQYRVDGVNAKSSVDLATKLPLLVLNGESFGLLVGPPKQRRQFYDWLVFHVKPEFRDTWRLFARSVKQRNSLLRHDKIDYRDVRPWDLELAKLSRMIEAQRIACMDTFLVGFTSLANQLEIPVGDIAVQYVNGWRDSDTFEQQLADSFHRDRKLGYTTLGPHKSDLKITVQGVPAGEVLSRGQQKSLIAALYVAEARSFSSATRGDCVFLIDDMPAELDADNIRKVAGWLNQTAAQVFVTSVEYSGLAEVWPDLDRRNHKVFHVERGALGETDLGIRISG